MEKLFPDKDLKEWKNQIAIMKDLVAISKQNPEKLLPHVKKIISHVSIWVDSLRSQVAGDAILCFSQLFQNLKSKMIVNKTYFSLLKRAASGDKGFLASEAENAMRAALVHVSSRRVALLLIRHSDVTSKSSAYRACVAQILKEAIDILIQKKADTWGLSVKDTVPLVSLLASFVSDGSPSVRLYAKQIITNMHQHIGRESVVSISMKAHMSMDKHIDFMRYYNKINKISDADINSSKTPKPRRKARSRSKATPKYKASTLRPRRAISSARPSKYKTLPRALSMSKTPSKKRTSDGSRSSSGSAASLATLSRSSSRRVSKTPSAPCTRRDSSQTIRPPTSLKKTFKRPYSTRTLRPRSNSTALSKRRGRTLTPKSYGTRSRTRSHSATRKSLKTPSRIKKTKNSRATTPNPNGLSREGSKSEVKERVWISRESLSESRQSMVLGKNHKLCDSISEAKSGRKGSKTSIVSRLSFGTDQSDNTTGRRESQSNASASGAERSSFSSSSENLIHVGSASREAENRIQGSNTSTSASINAGFKGKDLKENKGGTAKLLEIDNSQDLSCTGSKHPRKPLSELPKMTLPATESSDIQKTQQHAETSSDKQKFWMIDMHPDPWFKHEDLFSEYLKGSILAEKLETLMPRLKI